MNEDQFVNGVLLPSFRKAAEVLEEEGVEAEFSLGPSGAPGVRFLFPQKAVTIACIPVHGFEEIYRYEVSAFGYRSWVFPSIHLPEALPGFRYLPRLYDCLRFGMPDEVKIDGEIRDMYRRTRLQGLLEELKTLNPDVSLVPGKGSDGEEDVPILLLNEGEEELFFSYEHIIPQLRLCLLKITCGEDVTYLPEVGDLPETREYEMILPYAFIEEE